MRAPGRGLVFLFAAVLLLPAKAGADAIDAEPVVVSDAGFRDGDVLHRTLEKLYNGKNFGWKYSAVKRTNGSTRSSSSAGAPNGTGRRTTKPTG